MYIYIEGHIEIHSLMGVQIKHEPLKLDGSVTLLLHLKIQPRAAEMVNSTCYCGGARSISSTHIIACDHLLL